MCVGQVYYRGTNSGGRIYTYGALFALSFVESNVLFLKNRAWLLAATSIMTDLERKVDGSKLSKDVERDGGFALPIAFIMVWRDDIFHGGYIILGGFVDLMCLPEPIEKGAGVTDGSPVMDTNALC